MLGEIHTHTHTHTHPHTHTPTTHTHTHTNTHHPPTHTHPPHTHTHSNIGNSKSRNNHKKHLSESTPMWMSVTNARKEDTVDRSENKGVEYVHGHWEDQEQGEETLSEERN